MDIVDVLRETCEHGIPGSMSSDRTHIRLMNVNPDCYDCDDHDMDACYICTEYGL